MTSTKAPDNDAKPLRVYMILAGQLFDPITRVFVPNQVITIDRDAGVILDVLPQAAGRTAEEIVRGVRKALVAHNPGAATEDPLRGIEVTRINMSSMSVMPGMVDVHVHLFLHPYSETSWEDQLTKESLAERTVRATVHARKTLLAGFTTVRDLGTEGALDADIGLRKCLSGRNPLIPGPRYYCVTRAIISSGAYVLSNHHHQLETTTILNIPIIVKMSPNARTSPEYYFPHLDMGGAINVVTIADFCGRTITRGFTSARYARQPEIVWAPNLRTYISSIIYGSRLGMAMTIDALILIRRYQNRLVRTDQCHAGDVVDAMRLFTIAFMVAARDEYIHEDWEMTVAMWNEITCGEYGEEALVEMVHEFVEVVGGELDIGDSEYAPMREEMRKAYNFLRGQGVGRKSCWSEEGTVEVTISAAAPAGDAKRHPLYHHCKAIRAANHSSDSVFSVIHVGVTVSTTVKVEQVDKSKEKKEMTSEEENAWLAEIHKQYEKPSIFRCLLSLLNCL